MFLWVVVAISLCPCVAIGPYANPTPSYWLHNAELQQFRSTQDLPTTADVVVIGAGISGTSVAYGLAVTHNRSVTVIDARGVGGGATGRNSGGLTSSLDLPDAIAQYGPERAAALAQHKINEFTALVDWVDTNCGEHCDLRVDGNVQLYLNRSLFALAEAQAAITAQAGFGKNMSVWNSSECASKMGSLLDDFVGCLYTGYTGTIWAQRLAVAIAKQALATGNLNLQTNTVCEGVTRSGDAWEVRTPRGAIRAQQVVYAVNAWSKELLPQLLGGGVMEPTRAQVAVSEPVEMRWECDLGSDFGDTYGHQLKDGSVLLGGFRHITADAQVGRFDDNGTDPLVGAALRSFMPEHFPQLKGLRYAYEWTGLMAMTQDGMPWVGPVPDTQGAYMIAGMNGNGVQHGWLLGRALADLMVTGQLPSFWNEFDYFYNKVLPRR